MSSKSNEMIPYYSMDPKTVQMFAPVAEYLGLNKRANPETMKKKFIWSMIGFLVGIIVLGFLTVKTFLGNVDFLAELFSLSWMITIIEMIRFIRNYNRELPMDILTFKAVVDKDGMEKVFNDYRQEIRSFGSRALIGKDYLFMKDRTVVKLAHITSYDIHEVPDDESVTYYFRIYVLDSLGKRTYDVDTLSSNTRKRNQEFQEMKSILNSAQKRFTPLVLIDKQKGIEQHEQ